MKIYFIRHGNPCYNPDSLTKRGHVEAEITADYLKQFHISKIYSSTSVRAYETAEHLAKKLNLEIIKCPWATEDMAAKYTFDSFTPNGVRTWCFWDPKVRELFLKHQFNQEWYKSEDFADKPNYYEGCMRMHREVDAWLLSMNIKHDRTNNTYEFIGPVPDEIAMFAHGGMSMNFIPSILGLTYPFFSQHFEHSDTCGITIIEINPSNCKCALLKRYNYIAYSEEEVIKQLPEL